MLPDFMSETRARGGGEGLRNEAISTTLRECIAAPKSELPRMKLWKALAIASGLPGTRMNVTLANAFATEAAAHGAAADSLLTEMATLDADEAPGATDLEFLPVCGVLGLGHRGALDAKKRPDVLRILHDASEDLRFRVREVVPIALARIGERTGDTLVLEVAPWMDGYFQAAAVLSAMARPSWLDAMNDADPAIERLDEAYALAKNATRSASRYPGHKALVEALGVAPGALAGRFGVPLFDMLVRWAETTIPELREAITQNLRGPKLAGRHAADIERVRAAIAKHTAPPRDPTIIVHGTRGRGKKRGRGR